MFYADFSIGSTIPRNPYSFVWVYVGFLIGVAMTAIMDRGQSPIARTLRMAVLAEEPGCPSILRAVCDRPAASAQRSRFGTGPGTSVSGCHTCGQNGVVAVHSVLVEGGNGNRSRRIEGDRKMSEIDLQQYGITVEDVRRNLGPATTLSRGV